MLHCYDNLSYISDCEGIIEDAVLLGTPVTGNAKDWMPLSRVVAGRIVNGYCRYIVIMNIYSLYDFGY